MCYKLMRQSFISTEIHKTFFHFYCVFLISYISNIFKLRASHILGYSFKFIKVNIDFKNQLFNISYLKLIIHNNN